MAQIKGETPSVVDPETARLRCIEDAVRTNMPVKEDWPDWLIKGVRAVEEGGVVDSDWLTKQDAENSYI